MTTSSTGIAGASTSPPPVARRARPVWLTAGLLLLALAVVGLAWQGPGARIVLGAAGAAATVRGALLARAAGTGLLDERARPFGVVLAGVGLAALVAAAVSAAVSGVVLVVGVPLFLLLASGGLLARPGVLRRGGQVLLVWTVVVTGLLAGAGVVQGWDRAVAVAGVVGALALAAAGVVVMVGGGRLSPAARPAAIPPPAPAGCGGCACGSGGCGGLGG